MPNPTPTPAGMTAEQLLAEIDRLGRLVYVPGQWHCPRCNFTLQQMNMTAHDGTVTANDKPGEKCPNCDGGLWRCTWKADAIELSKRVEEFVLRAKDAERERDELAARLSGMAAVPDGWKLVPIEPTKRMMRKAENAIMRGASANPATSGCGRCHVTAYRAAVAAAPEVPGHG